MRLFSSFICLVLMYSCGFKNEMADLVVHNAHIFTVDENFSVHQAMAIRGDSIVELGPEREILNKYRAKESVDAQGQYIYPGFIDAHSHLLGYGMSLKNLNLKGVKSELELKEKLKTYIKKNTPAVVRGRGWDQSLWEGAKWPNRATIDSITENIPVLLQRIDGHGALVNKAALDYAGITETTKISGGYIDFSKGILKENAVDFVRDVLPEPDIKTQELAVQQAATNCISVGLTTVCDAGLKPNEIKVYLNLNRTNSLPIRSYVMADPSIENLNWYKKNGPIHSDFLHLHAIKAYMDGSLGSRSAALIEPYSDAPSEQGIITISKDSLHQLAQFAVNHNLQLNTHCIGDSALRVLFEVAEEHLPPNNDNRWRAEHVQVYHPDDVDNFRKLGIVPSVQPTHATSDAKWIEGRLGANRLNYAYAYKNLKNQLGWIPLGTDFPVEDIDPLSTYTSAVFRKAKGTNMKPILPKNALSPEDGLRGITIWAALALKMENEVGSLEVGKKADFVILNGDLVKSGFQQMDKIKVQQTFLNGKSVYQAF